MKRYHLSKDLKEVKEPAVQLFGRGEACAKGLWEQHIQPEAAYPTRRAPGDGQQVRVGWEGAETLWGPGDHCEALAFTESNRSHCQREGHDPSDTDTDVDTYLDI